MKHTDRWITTSPCHFTDTNRPRYSQVMENDDEGAQQRKIRFMDAGLAALGIRRLRGFLEEDEDNRTKKANVREKVSTKNCGSCLPAQECLRNHVR